MSNDHPLNVAVYCEILACLAKQEDIWKLPISKPKEWVLEITIPLGVQLSANSDCKLLAIVACLHLVIIGSMIMDRTL